MKLALKPPSKHFIFSLILIFTISLAFLGWIYYATNIQYQKYTSSFINGPVTLLPKTLKLDLNQPDDESLTFNSSTIVSGTTTPKKEVLIFTDSKDLVIKSKDDGSFSTALDLNEGINRITVAVFDKNGDSKSIERTIYYSEEKI